jgi:hypothetical protein
MTTANPTSSVRARTVLATFALALLGTSPSIVLGAAPAKSSGAETYTWSAELVALDAAHDTVTVRSRLIEDPDVADFSSLRPNETVMLTWTGLSTAAGVRAIERGTTSTYDRMTMPVEYVSNDFDGRYVTFKVPIPMKDAASLAKLKPGDYVTAVSPARARNSKEAVVSIRPYTDVG